MTNAFFFYQLGIYRRGTSRKISFSVSRTIFHCIIFSSFMGNYSQYKNRAGPMGTCHMFKECVSGLWRNEIWFERLHSIRNKLQLRWRYHKQRTSKFYIYIENLLKLYQLMIFKKFPDTYIRHNWSSTWTWSAINQK